MNKWKKIINFNFSVAFWLLELLRLLFTAHAGTALLLFSVCFIFYRAFLASQPFWCYFFVTFRLLQIINNKEHRNFTLKETYLLWNEGEIKHCLISAHSKTINAIGWDIDIFLIYTHVMKRGEGDFKEPDLILISI